MVSHVPRCSRLCSYERQYAHQRNRSCVSQFCVCCRAFLCPVSWPAVTDNCRNVFVLVMKNSHQRVGSSVRNGKWKCIFWTLAQHYRPTLPFTFCFLLHLRQRNLLSSISRSFRTAEFLKASQLIVQHDPPTEFGSISNGCRTI